MKRRGDRVPQTPIYCWTAGWLPRRLWNAVNDYINTQGHHGHGDDMQCYAMPETRHDLAVTVSWKSGNLTDDEQNSLKDGIENMIRCAFRENADFDVRKTWPYSRFSFSQLGRDPQKPLRWRIRCPFHWVTLPVS